MRPLARGNGERRREYVATRAKADMTAAERVLLHRIIKPSGCWELRLAVDRVTGYSQITVGGKVQKGHRVSYEAFVGPIPDGLHLDHLCRNRACVNPEHLEPVTPLINVRRSPITHGNETHCPQGHEYDESNTYRTGGRRHCRTCRRAYLLVYRSMTPDQRAARLAAGLPVVDLSAYFADLERQERAA